MYFKTHCYGHWAKYLVIHIFYVFVASRVSGVNGETKNQNIWLQVSPYPRPTYGYKGSGKNVFIIKMLHLRLIKTINDLLVHK